MTDSSVTLADLHYEDALLVLASMPAESVDSIVTDPPYGIEFMGKEWDKFKAKDRNTGAKNAGQTKTWCDKDSSGIGVGGPRFTTQTAADARTYQDWFYEIALECLRVLKPGGHMLAFGGTRMYHRMAVAIEDAGFEIRDSIHWTYGSGFPKSLDVSKAIDKQAGAKRKVTREGTRHGTAEFDNAASGERERRDVPATEAAKQWQGWGTALKPSHEPIVVARKPLAGTVAQNVLAYGTGALNIDGTRVGSETVVTTNGKGFAGSFEGGTNTNGGAEHQGRWPANTVLTHSAGCQATGETITDDITINGEGNDNHFHGNFKGGHDKSPKSATTALFACVPGCPVALLDQQSGVLSPGHWAKTKVTGYGKGYGGTADYTGPGEKATDKGGASRFFTTTEWTELDDLTPFLYVAKPSKKERDAGLDAMPEQQIVQFQTGNGASGKPSSISEGRDTKRRNTHPTVKPVALMRHLVRLVTPPGGVVLDPFTGSGTTGVAAILEDCRFIGIEKTDEYQPIIEGRINHAINNRPADTLPLT